MKSLHWLGQECLKRLILRCFAKKQSVIKPQRSSAECSTAWKQWPEKPMTERVLTTLDDKQQQRIRVEIPTRLNVGSDTWNVSNIWQSCLHHDGRRPAWTWYVHLLQPKQLDEERCDVVELQCTITSWLTELIADCICFIRWEVMLATIILKNFSYATSKCNKYRL